MSWTHLLYAAAAIAGFYLLTWLYSLMRRVDALEAFPETIGNVQLRVVQLESRLNQWEKWTTVDPQTGVGSLAWLDSERWFAALRSTDPL
ncbi:MAG: hypothetical protein QM758_27520 [Armatimonas sp.]